MCALKHGSIKLIAHCGHASLHIFTIHYGFRNMEVQNQASVKNSDSCPFPNGSGSKCDGHYVKRSSSMVGIKNKRQVLYIWILLHHTVTV